MPRHWPCIQHSLYSSRHLFGCAMFSYFFLLFLKLWILRKKKKKRIRIMFWWFKEYKIKLYKLKLKKNYHKNKIKIITPKPTNHQECHVLALNYRRAYLNSINNCNWLVHLLFINWNSDQSKLKALIIQFKDSGFICQKKNVIYLTREMIKIIIPTISFNQTHGAMDFSVSCLRHHRL